MSARAAQSLAPELVMHLSREDNSQLDSAETRDKHFSKSPLTI